MRPLFFGLVMRLGASVLGLSVMTAAAQADDERCADVVEATVAEAKAGAGGAWSPETESLVRQTAGAACIKAQSGRYEASPAAAAPMTNDSAIAEESVSASSTEGASSAQATAEKTAAPDADEEGTTVGGITFKPMSGNPNKKSFERKRATD